MKAELSEREPSSYAKGPITCQKGVATRAGCQDCLISLTPSLRQDKTRQDKILLTGWTGWGLPTVTVSPESTTARIFKCLGPRLIFILQCPYTAGVLVMVPAAVRLRASSPSLVACDVLNPYQSRYLNLCHHSDYNLKCTT